MPRCEDCGCVERKLYKHSKGYILCDDCLNTQGGTAEEIVDYSTDPKVQRVISELEAHIRISKETSDSKQSMYTKDLIDCQTAGYRESLRIVKSIFEIE